MYIRRNTNLNFKEFVRYRSRRTRSYD